MLLEKFSSYDVETDVLNKLKISDSEPSVQHTSCGSRPIATCEESLGLNDII